MYNQEKASAIRNAVPNPLAVLSMSNSVDWKGMAISAVYSIIDSYTNYKKASSAADLEFLKSGWELDDDETETIRKNRDRAFDYMVDMVQEYDLDGKLTLNEEQISEFAEICKIDSNQEKIRRLESENQTYKLLGNYWLELASCYFEASDYQKCLDAVDEYNKLATGIYRKDFNYVQVLPKAIVAAQQVYSGDKYVSRVGEFADELIDNTDTKEWSTRYFAAEVYLDLYGKTKDESYLNKAYNIAYDNVTILLNDQRTLNDTYLADVKKVSVDKPDYSFMTKDEKNKAEDDYEAEKKRAKSYYDGLVKARKTELPPVYEPLAVNCEMLFDLAQEKKISKKEQNEIEEILQTANNGIFLSKIVNNKYSFTKPETEYNAELTMRKFSVPADQLSEDAVVKATISENGEQMEIDDFVLNKVRRKGSTVDTFIAEYSSNKLFMHKWKKNSQVSVTINHGEGYEPVTYKFSISKFKAIGALPIVVEFDQE